MAKVLIIEDDDAIRNVWRAVLEDAGHEVRDAATGVGAAESVRRAPVDVVVSDILMPEMDGIETLLALKKDPSAPCFIVASGGGALGDRRFLDVAERLGADVTLQKPVDLDTLCREVARLSSGG